MKFVFDLDGTICFQGQPVSERILSSLEHLVNEGHEVIFASARPIRDLLPVLRERFHHYPMIGGNGSIVAANGNIVSTASFDERTVAHLLNLIKEYDATYLIDSEWDYAYTGPADHPILRNLDPEQRANNVRLEQLEQIIKILVLTSNDMDGLARQVRLLPVVIHHHGNEGILDISPTGVDKWSGLQRLGVKEGEYIAFGNDANDVSMFRHARYSVMIGEHAQLKRYASEQLASDEQIESHIAHKLEQLAKSFK